MRGVNGARRGPYNRMKATDINRYLLYKYCLILSKIPVNAKLWRRSSLSLSHSANAGSDEFI